MKFRVTQDLDYITGHLRYGHKEGVVEVESEEELKELINTGDISDYMSIEVDDYEVEDYDDGGNGYEYERV